MTENNQNLNDFVCFLAWLLLRFPEGALDVILFFGELVFGRLQHGSRGSAVRVTVRGPVQDPTTNMECPSVRIGNLIRRTLLQVTYPNFALI